MAHPSGPVKEAAARALLSGLNGLAGLPTLRRAVFATLERRATRHAAQSPDPRHPPAVEQDRLALRLAFLHLAERVVAEQLLGSAALRGFFSTLLQGVMVRHGGTGSKARFRLQHGCSPPDFLVLSPGKACNLRCEGCYAAAGPAPERLEWATLERVVGEAHDLWGARFFILSGGEPLMYQDGGRGVLDLALAHPDCFFVMYTNGTLITDEMARRLGEAGNLSPALSVEGLRERTDARRGKGVFSRVLVAMERLREHKVLFGLSLTATRQNADEVLSEQVVDTFFGDMGAMYAFVFHYMPMGRRANLDLMMAPEQRFALWQRVWQLVRDERLLILDFWNSGTASNGCIAAGRTGGYFHVNWDGAASPCVFIPFSPINVKDVYASGGTLDDVWGNPFFRAIRDWQKSYGYREPGERYAGGGNWLLPCLIRDHHGEFCRLLERHNPVATDPEAGASRADPAYHQELEEFGRRMAELADPAWRQSYCPCEEARPVTARRAERQEEVTPRR